MNKDEIKKALNVQKTKANKTGVALNGEYIYYRAALVEGTELEFKVPFSDAIDYGFEEKVSAKLLIRWLVA